jgi:hypothetical protein
MKALTVIFFCSWKFAATFPVAILAMNMTAGETLLYSNIGGILGTLGSVYLSGFLLKLCRRYWPERLVHRKKARKVFSRANRRLVKIKSTYGLYGIVVLSPVILSIPLGAFLTVKYYGIRKSNILLLIAGQIFWSLVYTFFYTQAKALVV